MIAHHYPALKRRAKFRLPLRGRIRRHYFFITTDTRQDKTALLFHHYRIMTKDDSITEKTWQLITLAVTRAMEETASALLFDAGTTGIITLEESDDEVK